VLYQIERIATDATLTMVTPDPALWAGDGYHEAAAWIEAPLGASAQCRLLADQ
jgi:hypothetical protein